MDAVLICVPTPLNDYHEPDLSYVTQTAKSIAPYLREGQLIVLESTTYPGTTEEVWCRCLNREMLDALRVARGRRTSVDFMLRFPRSAKTPATIMSRVATFQK